MKTLALSNGDLMVGQGGHTTVSGAAKVRQELALALGERFGTDRFHADQWGSTVTDYLGQPIDDSLMFEVKAEVSRVIAQYIAIQDAEIYQDYVEGKRSRFDTADVIRSVTSIEAIVGVNAINLTVALLTQAGVAVTLNRTIA